MDVRVHVNSRGQIPVQREAHTNVTAQQSAVMQVYGQVKAGVQPHGLVVAADRKKGDVAGTRILCDFGGKASILTGVPYTPGTAPACSSDLAFVRIALVL